MPPMPSSLLKNRKIRCGAAHLAGAQSVAAKMCPQPVLVQCWFGAAPHIEISAPFVNGGCCVLSQGPRSHGLRTQICSLHWPALMRFSPALHQQMRRLSQHSLVSRILGLHCPYETDLSRCKEASSTCRRMATLDQRDRGAARLAHRRNPNRSWPAHPSSRQFNHDGDRLGVV